MKALTGILATTLFALLTTSVFGMLAEPADTVIVPSKDHLSTQLVQLRDSINDTRVKIDEKAMKRNAQSKQIIEDADRALLLQRKEIETVLDAVVATTPAQWDENIRTRALMQLKNSRDEYRRVRQSLKSVLSAKAS